MQTTACPPSYKFTGYERDPETSLDYAFARYYSSRLGRFLSTDPLGGTTGNLQSHNAYAYVRNNALNYIDPSGLDCSTKSASLCDSGGSSGLGIWGDDIWDEQLPWDWPIDWQTLVFGPPELADFATPTFLEPGTAYYNPAADPGTAYYDACPSEKRRFFDWLDEPVGGMATDLNVPEPLLLTLAAKEGGWNDEGLNHNMPLNNPFGVQDIINGRAAGNHEYNSLVDAINDWEHMYGDRVRDVDTPQDFVNGLQHPQKGMPYNTADPKWEKKYIKDIYPSMQKYMNRCGIQ